MEQKLVYTSGLIVFVVAALAAIPAAAQTVANGPYYAIPSWDQTLPSSTRFIVLSNMNSAAVLDRETGLVWQRTPAEATRTRASAIFTCWNADTGGRGGWRLPRADELLTLADATTLPAGHPFVNVINQAFWALDLFPPLSITSLPFTVVGFFDDSASAQSTVGPHRSWCVRGGQGSPFTH